MKRGEALTVAIERLAPDGDGIVVIDGRAIHVKGAVPGDVAKIRIQSLKRESAKAAVEGLDSTSVPRIEAPCPHFGSCGGCRWQDIPYPEQCRLKTGLIRDILGNIPGMETPADIPLVPSPDVFHYRNKMEFSFDSPPGSGEIHLGLHERGKFDRVFDVADCRLLSARSNEIVRAVRAFAVERGVTIYGFKSHRGLFRFLVVREGKLTGETMIVIVTSGEEFMEEEAFAAMIQSEFPDTVSLVRGINRTAGSVAACRERTLLSGSEFIHERIGDLTFAISPDSFFQTNSRQALSLYETVGEFSGLDGGGHLLDLYCGTGTIGIFLSHRADRVTGVEISEDAIRDARMNAGPNGADNCTFIAGGVEDILDERLGSFDVVVCDPPRAGIHPKAMSALLRMRIPRLVYVSCNAGAIPRDLEMLAMAGYRIRDVRVFDMAPHTPHVETVIGLAIG